MFAYVYRCVKKVAGHFSTLLQQGGSAGKNENEKLKMTSSCLPCSGSAL